MESEVKTVVCPNCGASAHNLNNCEFCGSLLVRFTDKGIDESNYRHESFRFEGIEDALMCNLEEQARTGGKNHVTTFITAPDLNLELQICNPAAQTEMLSYNWNNYSFLIKPNVPDNNETQSLSICVRFYEITDKLWGINGNSVRVVRELNAYNAEAHSRFQNMDIYSLFNLEITDFLDNNNTPGMKIGKVYQYYFNFGRDIDGAAAIISQYFLHNFNISPDDDISLQFEQTSTTPEEYTKAVTSINKSANTKKYLGIVFGALVLIIGLFSLVTDGSSLESIWMILGGVGFIVAGLYYYGNRQS